LGAGSVPPSPCCQEERHRDFVAARAGLRSQAAAAIARSSELVIEADSLQYTAVQLQLASRAHMRFASLCGVVEQTSVNAVVRTDGGMSGDRLLLRRADLVVALGDTFDDGRIAAGSPGSPIATTLTLLRACDRVTNVSLVRRGVAAARTRRAG
jgi:hypothetical protein